MYNVHYNLSVPLNEAVRLLTRLDVLSSQALNCTYNLPRSMAPSRRKSIDSSSSSSSSSSDSSRGGKKHKEKKKEKKLKKDKDHKNSSGSHNYVNTSQSAARYGSGFSDQQHAFPVSQPPSFLPPPSGFRVPLTTTAPFPDPNQAGQPPCYDADGVSPVFIGSALLDRSVHPCKIGPHLQPYASVPYGGGEYGHHGRFDLLPFRPDQMEFVHTSHGLIPAGRRPIEGGYEEDGNKLYHAVAVVNGVRVPGKTGEHLYVLSFFSECCQVK